MNIIIALLSENSLDIVLKKSDILILATPHKVYKKIKTKKPLIDIWNFILCSW